MTNTIDPTAIDPMQPALRQDAPEILPGTSIIGSGVDIFGEYCAGTSVKLPIIDFPDRDQKVDGTDFRTSKLIHVRPASEGMASSIEASTLADASTKFSASVGLKGKYGFFSGELNAAYDTTSSHKTSTRYAQYTEKLYFKQLYLDSFTALRKYMTENAKSDFEGGMSAEDLVHEYGTRYIKSLMIGARLNYSCTIDQSQYNSSVDMSMAAKASYQGLTGQVSGSVSSEVKSASEAITKNAVRQARVLGGDPQFVHSVLEGSYEDWRASTRTHMHVVDLFNGMGLISELIEDPVRRAEVEAVIKATEANAGLPPAPYEAPVMAFHANNPSRWFYTVKSDERPAGYGGENTPFTAFTKPQDGTVPIYRLSAKGPDRYMLSANSDTRAGWSNAEVVFHAYNGPGAGRKPVYAHYNTAHSNTSGWHYSTNKNVASWTEDPSNKFFVPIN